MKGSQKRLSGIDLIVTTIRFNWYIIAATFAGIFLVMVAPRLIADEVEANLIQIIDTSNFPSPDPAGIVYLPSQDVFLVTDSEINEMSIFQGANVFKVDRNGSLLDTFSTIPFSDEPTGITINPANSHCFFSDDTGTKLLYEIDPGDDNICLTSDDTVTSFDFGINDPEDVTYGIVDGEKYLFIADGANNKVYRIEPGANGVFDNFLTGDDLFSSFDTESLGIIDPEGIVFNSANNTLFIVGSRNDLIIQTTIEGILLHTIDISTLNPIAPAGLALAPSSEDQSNTNLYMVTRGVDNDSDPNENDGTIYELQIPTITTPGNGPTIRNVPGDYPTIQQALSSAVDGDTILLAPGTYQVNETIYIDKNNISIVSRYLTSGDENDIDNTIIKGVPTLHTFDGLLGQSANLKIIGLTITDSEKAINFEDDYGEVHYCKLYNTLRDAISFDTNAGGAVTHTRVENAGDDAIDIDTRRNGSFLIAFNELINSRDDSIEIHLYNTSSDLNMHYDIHDNLLSGAGEDGIQLIDFDKNSKRTFDIYRNIIQGMPDVAIGSMFEETREDFQGAPMTERVRIYNNYFYNNGYHITGGDNMIILNNIFEAAATAAIKRVKVDSIVDHNIFYNNPIDTQDTLTGNNNLYSNPQRNSDFTLRQGSPAIDAGTSSYTHLSELVLQIANSEYSGQKPDIGRYEYALNNTAPVITIIGANPITLDLGDTFTDPGATAFDDPDGNITALIQTSSTVNTDVAGSYLVTYTVSDSDGNTASATRSVVVSDGTYFLHSRVSASADDAEEYPDGRMYLNSSDLELVIDKDLQQTVGVRFNTLAIPENAIISKAYIQFKVDETDLLADTLFNIVGERTGNAPSFTSTNYNISSRSKTNASVLWSPSAWSTVGAIGEEQRTADLSSIIQEIVSETGWSSGNAIAFIFTGSGTRVAEAYDGDQAGAPLLYLEYTTDDNAIAPVLTLLGDNPMTLNIGDTFTDPGATAFDEADGNITALIQTSSTVNTDVAGSYLVTYTVSDSDGNTASASRNVIVSDGTYFLQSRVSTSADDAEEYPDGRMYLNSSDLELVVNKDLQQTVGVRFNAISIPENAIIRKAYIQFKVDERPVNTAQITIYGEKTANAPGFTNTNYNISSRSKTDAFVSWSPVVWDTIGAAGEEQRTADLSSIVQEIVSETAWSSGNAIAFIFTGSGTRVAEAYNGDQAGAPLLYLEYTTDATAIAPEITLLGDNPMTLNIGDTFTDPGATAVDDIDGNITALIQTSSTVNTDVAGSYLVTYTVSDSDGNTASASRNVIVSDGTYSLQNRVATSADDAEEYPDGKIYLNSSDLELVVNKGVQQTVGLRFNALVIPENTVINKAYIQFKVDERPVNTAQITIYGEKTANAPGFTNTNYSISSRNKTNISVSWSPAVWDTIGAAGEEQRTADLSSIIQEIVSETGWSSGNAMAFILTGTGTRVAEAYDGDQAGAALLYIEFSEQL